MLQQILIIGSDLNSCKKLKYSLQNDLIRAYYTLSIDDGIRHLIHYGYHLKKLQLHGLAFVQVYCSLQIMEYNYYSNFRR